MNGMAFGRENLAARHPLAKEPLLVPPPHSLKDALDLERMGNWPLAGETYSDLDDAVGSKLDPENRARLLARAATCFEFGLQHAPAARTYSDAARLLSQSSLRPQAAGELFNRSGHQYYKAGDFFFAGNSWRSAGTEFHKIGKNVIIFKDSIRPVPVSAAGDTVAADCFNMAGDTYLRAQGFEMFSCAAYWEAGRLYANTYPSPNIQTFMAYQSALNAAIRHYKTLDLKPLRNSLPLTQEERASKVDPIKIMEEAAYRCNFHHQPPMIQAQRAVIAHLQTNRQLTAVFHEFSLLFAEIGNARESGHFRAAEKERQREIYLAERRYAKAGLYAFWRLTAGYGESLSRWAISCMTMLALFAFSYHFFQAIKPVTGWFDYLYYSAVTFTSLGAGDIEPANTIGKILICSEIGTGLIMFGVLLSFVGNRINR
jgi:hypothetical protein